MAVLRATNLEKSFGSVEVLSGLSFEVGAGELFGVLGPNGAGKTTTIAILTGQLTPDAGDASVLGTDPTSEPVRTRSRVGILPEQQPPPSFLTPREYLEFVGSIRSMEPESVHDRLETWATRLGFQEKLDTLHTDLSRGQQQKVMISQAFLHEPELVFIDEPLVNLDPLAQEQVTAFLRQYVDRGNTIVVSTHNIDVAAGMCTRVGIVVDGTCRIVGQNTDEAVELRKQFLEAVETSDDKNGASLEGAVASAEYR
ncbi:ABC transporter ATP-binding protein [Natrialbaceae archaeon A-CW3]